jgi:hypothetical protein
MGCVCRADFEKTTAMKQRSHLHIDQTRWVIAQALIQHLSKLVNKALAVLFYKNQSSVR